MARTETIVKTLYKFDELDESAKGRARDWFRAGALDHAWWDAVYEDAAACGAVFGIELRQKPVKLMNGTTRYDPSIWFSGFSSQGDGACFEGTYSYAKGGAKKIRKHAPKDAELHRIADELQAVQKTNRYRLTASMSHRGHYYHSGCMSVSVDDNETRVEGWLQVEETVTQLMRDFADWIYRQLEKEHDWQLADEQVDESIRANEYEFTEDGNIA